TFSGKNLTEEIIITASQHFEVSINNNSFSSSLTLPLTDGTLASTIVYVRFNPASAAQAVVDGTVKAHNTNFHRTYEVSGKEGDPALDPITILYQDFEDDSYMDWQRKTLSGDRRWEIKEYNQNKYMQMSGYESNKTESKIFDTYLISPPLDLDQYKNEILTFATKNGYYNGTTLTVLISTDYDGQNPIEATWSELSATLDETDHQEYGDNFIPSGEVDLSGFQGTAYLAYRYLGDNEQLTTTYQVDDIVIEGNWEDFTATMGTNVSTPPLMLPYTTSETAGAAQSYDLTFTDITEDISVTADGYFEISFDGTTWSKTLSIASTASSPQSIQVRYTPHVEYYAAQTGTITHKTAGAKTLTLDIQSETAGTIADGSALEKDQTLDVVTWNLNWFGAPNMSDYATTYDEQLDAVSAQIISMDADIYALQEVVSDEVNGDYLTPLIEKLNELAGSEKYTAILSDRYSGDDSQPSTDFPSQRLCYVFNTQTVASVMDTAMFSDVYPNTQTSSIDGYDGNASTFWSYGRVPHMLKAHITIAGTTESISLVNLHAKCCSDGYERRKDDADYLLNALNTTFSEENLVVLGDFNDYLDGSTSGVTSPYKEWFSNDYQNFRPFSSSSIDHVVLSNELYYEAQSLAPNSSAPEVAISDHDPVLLRMQLFTTKEAQSISFDPLGSSVFGADALTLSAEASSGLPIAYHVESGPGTITGNQLSINGAGEIVVVAYQVGNDSYQPAAAKQTLTVAKAEQTLTFSLPAEMDIQNAPLELEASASSGLPVSYTLTSGQGTISGNEFTPNAAGSYTIEASQPGNSNYSPATPVSETIEVTGTTDLPSQVKKEVKVYPNPANRIVTIELPTHDKAIITLLNMTGSIVKQFTAEKTCKLNVHPYRNGVYFIKIETEGYIITKRIMISR
ncbi:MAG: T9SS type A sorting domain-containing protein, partial [Bacteroidales bacterium]